MVHKVDQSNLQGGFVRLRQIIGPEGPIPISRSAWYAGIRAGKFPAPVKIGPRTAAWRRTEIQSLLERLGALK